MDKDFKLFYSIKEVAEMFGVNETLLRYWEKEFPNIAPRKSGRNIRQYSKEDVEEVRVVYNLVKVRGLKIAAAREALKTGKKRAVKNTSLMERLEGIKSELEALRRELEHVV